MAEFRRLKNLLRNASFISCAFLITTACTNDESSDFIENNPVIQQSSKVNAKPLDYRYQTWEEVESKFAEINAKYNTGWMSATSLSPQDYTEEFFVTLENYIKEQASLDNTQK
ncbi:MAG: hypothetical protein E7087_00555 [Bacteroidales bacterium]|nr:hypothetical protein [Bacteroidales bacterium]MBO5263010.1 hypothetical protein [Bacteroidaceae bacterium]